MSLSNAERQRLYRAKHKAVTPVTKRSEIVTKSDSNVTPVTGDVMAKFTGSPVHCLPDDYNRDDYLALLPDDIRRLVVDANVGLVASGKENNSTDLDLRIARAVHYQEYIGQALV